MIHHCKSCPGTAALLTFLEDQLANIDSSDKFHFSQWDIKDRVTLTAITTTYGKCKEVLLKTIKSHFVSIRQFYRFSE